MRGAAIALAAAVVGVPTASAVPRHHIERTRSGAVEAVFSYSADLARYRFTGQRLTIRRGRTNRFRAALRHPPCAGCSAQPANFFDHKRSVSIRDLDGDGEPEVVLDLYWGGAHCCWYTQIYRYLPATATYRPLVHVWGDFGYRLADLDGDGMPELITADDRFSYAFASFADSRWPIRILSYRGGGLTFVTRSYPVEIDRDATGLWREARGHKDNYGILAAWAADECLLGHATRALQTLEGLRRTGRLSGQLESPSHYLKHLHRFLRRTGYLQSR
jgi:hypothetical protein